MKNTFHWYIYISCRLSAIHYYSFLRQFENFVFILSNRADQQYYSSSYIYIYIYIYIYLIWHVGKHISLLSTRLDPLENSFLIHFAGLVRWKNNLSFACPDNSKGWTWTEKNVFLNVKSFELSFIQWEGKNCRCEHAISSLFRKCNQTKAFFSAWQIVIDSSYRLFLR